MLKNTKYDNEYVRDYLDQTYIQKRLNKSVDQKEPAESRRNKSFKESLRDNIWIMQQMKENQRRALKSV